MEQTIIITGITLTLIIILGLAVDVGFFIYRSKELEARLEGKLTEKDIRLYKKKYPDVSEEFMRMTQREQLIANNRYIHNLNKRYDVIQAILDKNIELIEALTQQAKV